MKPDDEGGSYKQAISVLYRVAYTLKMSYKSDHRMEGFFEYVVPPLEEMDEYLEQNGYCKEKNNQKLRSVSAKLLESMKATERKVPSLYEVKLNPLKKLFGSTMKRLIHIMGARYLKSE